MRAFSFKRWSRTTFGLVTIVGVVFGLVTLVIGVIAFEATHEALEQQLDHRIATETAALIDEGDDGPAGVAIAIGRREAARSTASLDFRLVDANSHVVAGSLDAVVPEKPGYVELLPYRRDGTARIAQSLTTLLPSGHRLLVAADRGVIDEMDRSLIKLFVGAFGVMLALGVGAAWVVGIVTRNRLARLDHTATAIIGGDLGQRMHMTFRLHCVQGPLLLTGTDCPPLQPEHLRRAARALLAWWQPWSRATSAPLTVPTGMCFAQLGWPTS